MSEKKMNIEIGGRGITLDIDALSKGLCEMHNQDQKKKTMLAFGMLDAKLMEVFENNLATEVRSSFTPQANELFDQKIKDFLKQANHQVAVGIYQHAKLIV